MIAKSSNWSVSAMFCPMLVEKPYSRGVISLAYKLVNLLVFEKILYKMSKNWVFSKIIGLGLNCTYEFEVCYILRERKSHKDEYNEYMQAISFKYWFFKFVCPLGSPHLKKQQLYFGHFSNRIDPPLYLWTCLRNFFLPYFRDENDPWKVWI